MSCRVGPSRKQTTGSQGFLRWRQHRRPGFWVSGPQLTVELEEDPAQRTHAKGLQATWGGSPS